MKTSSVLFATAALIAGGLVSSALAVPTAFNTVRTLDAGVGTAGNTLTGPVDAASNGPTVTFANFSTLVANAYDANLGGVIDFETANLVAGGAALNVTTGASLADALSGRYGTSHANTLSFYRTDANTTATNALDYNNNNGTLNASGTNYLGNQGNTNISIAFATSLLDLGFTLVPRADARQVVSTFTVHFADGTTAVSSTVTTNGTAQTTQGTFFGFQGTAINPITSLDFANTNNGTGTPFARIDDLAFIVNPVAAPEPASLGLLALGGVGLLRRRRA